MNLNVVVTGGAGFIGTNLCRLLCQDARVGSVRVLDDLSAGTAAGLPRQVHLTEADVTDEIAVAAVLAGADAVVHLAARSSVAEGLRDPVRTYRTNATGTATVLQAARRAGVRRVVLASSAAVYGDVPRGAPPRPLGPYGASKLAAEIYAQTAQAAFGTPVTVLRLFNVFGPGQRVGGDDGAVLPTFITRALRGLPVTVHGDGQQTRDFTFVDDVCALMATAALEPPAATVTPGPPGATVTPGPDSPIDVGTGRGQTLLQVIGALRDLLGGRVECRHTASRPGDIRNSHADTGALEARFPGFASTPFDAALRATLEWYRERDRLASSA